MKNDLRSFIRAVEDANPEEAREVNTEVDPRLEITAIIGKLEKQDRYPLLSFTRVKGSKMPVVASVAIGFKRLGMAMGLPEAREQKEYFRYSDSYLKEYLARRNQLLPPKVVSTGPCKEVIRLGKESDVTKFPIPVTSELDDAPYVTSGITVVRDPGSPDTPFNLGIYRHKLIGQRKLGLYYSWGKYIHRVHKKAEEEGRPLDVAICIGCHPALYYAATDQAHLSEYSLAGAYLGEPVELVKCETSDLMVPASSEIVIEAKLMPKVRQTEGPFGEYAGYYGEVVEAPLAEITCITHRADPVYHFVPSGRHAEHLSGGLGAVMGACATVKKQYPSVQAVSKPWRLSFVVGVRIEKLNEGDPVTIGVLTSSLSQYNKYVVVVDGDVDIFDERELMWAVATRCRADEDFHLIPNSRGNRLDPSSYNASRTDRGAMVTKVIIDATRKFLSNQGTTEISEPMVEKVDLASLGLAKDKPEVTQA